MFFSKTITIASLMALLVSSALATGETYLVAAFAGMQVFGSDGCAGQLVSTVTGFSEDVWGECWNNPEPTTCMTLHDIAGGEHLCEVRTVSYPFNLAMIMS